MKRIRRMLALLLVPMLIIACARADTELFFINVGKGDAILARSGDMWALIDAGKKKAYDAIERAMEALGVTYLDAVFLTHCDKDHAGGLKKLAKSGVGIGAIYISAYNALSEGEEHPGREAASRAGCEARELRAGDVVPFGDAHFSVLAPIAEDADDEDNNSLVLQLESDDGRALLCGDMKDAERDALLAAGADIRCDVIKIPCHGSGEGINEALVAAAGARLAVISTSTEEKPSTPSAAVTALLERAGCAVYVTQDADMGIRVTMRAGEIGAETVD